MPPTVRFMVTRPEAGEVGVEAGKQFEIEMAIRGEIECAGAGELHASRAQ